MNYGLTFVHVQEDSQVSYPLQIYKDDTIDNVKSKLSRLLENKNTEEYYFFAKRKTILNPYDEYKRLSFQNTRTIPYETFYSFCINHELPCLSKKESYELDDFLELETDVLSTIPIGIVHDTPFIVHPFKNKFNQLEDSGTSSNSLWMPFSDLVEDTVYVCLASEVYAFSKKNGLEIANVFNVYYPYLFKENRLEPSLFKSQEKSYTDYNEIMDFHHSIYKPEAILTEGVTSLYFVMYTLQPFQFPLDIFFKLFHSTSRYPYIKLNGMKTNENMYRLYCNQMSENGYKIPFLKKRTILKYAHEMNKNSISYLFYDKDVPIFLNLDKRGHLYFRLDQIPFLSIETIEAMLKEATKPFLRELSSFFDPSQKIFAPFESLSQDNIAILDLKYKANYKKEGKMNVKKYMTCFSPLFNFMNEKDKISLRYKRVSNYNESQSKDAYLIEAFNKNIPIEEIIQVFSANFMKHDDKASADYVHQFFSMIEIEEKQNNLRRVKINPGFLVEIEKKENIEVTVHSIDNIHYIPFIRLYITNLVLISQGIVSDQGKCKKIKEIAVKEIKPVKPVETNEEDFRMNAEIEDIDDPDEEADIPVDFDELKPPSVSPSKDSLTPPSLTPPSLTPPSSSPSKNSLTPPSVGGSVSDETLYSVFIYDENDPYSLKEKFKKEPLREARLIDYFRAFQGNECTLIKKENETCKGYVIELTGSEFKELSNGASPFFIDYLDKPGNSYPCVTYTRDPLEWSDHPTVQFVKKVYATVAYGWKHKQDDKDEMYIYDIHNELKARYNNKYYVKLDEAEELTKIQFTPVNPLLKRLQDREPVLFTKTDKTHNQYSRMCLWSEKRQPVILTKEEKERIDQIAPGSYESSIEYGTDSKKPYYYICPRYWDLKHNIPVDAKDVDKDKLISRNSSDSEKQKHIQSRYILELAKPGDKPVYQTRVGFLTKKHPNGYYMPCCFMSKPKKDKPDAIDKRIEEALQYYQRKTEDVNEKVVDYIQNGDKFPLTENRKGHLTPILERFFNLKYSDCYSQLQKKKLKLNYPCLLRHGVKEEQPFLSSLSFLYFKKSVPLTQFIHVLLDKINLDNIQKFHNGGIVNTFAKEEKVDVSKYKNTHIYRTMKDSPAFKRIVSGYEQFVQYLKSDDYIDYTYLWDIVTEVLFKEKVNLVVLKEGLEDVTQNLQIVCPTTSHAIYSFDEKYPSLLIYQKGDLFEPLYIYKKMDDKTDKTITLFDLQENIPSVHAILKQIHRNIGSCQGQTLHKSYLFKENLFLEEILAELKKTPYKVGKQIMNLDGRIIGVMVKKEKDNPFFVPCRPSAVSGDYELLDDSLWQDYRTTVYWLNKLSEDSKEKIRCKPKIRVLENHLVVGILTETNQFIPLKEPEENKMKDELASVDEYNRLKVDETIQKGDLAPKEKVIQHLKLEQMFYNAFFNTMKVELNDSAHLSTRKRIEKAIRHKDREKIEELFEPLFEDKFLFVDDYDIDLYSLTNINLCKNNEEPYCGKLEHDGKLLIPNENLFNHSDNSQGYKARFIDDLLMNVHIQRILFEEIHSTLYYTDRFHLSDTEILLLESDLSTYLDKEPVKKIHSVTYAMLEDVQPSRILEFVDKVETEEEPEKEDPFLDSESEEEPVIPQVKSRSLSKSPLAEAPLSEVPLSEATSPKQETPVLKESKKSSLSLTNPKTLEPEPEEPEPEPESEEDSEPEEPRSLKPSKRAPEVLPKPSMKPLGTSLNVPQKSIALLNRKLATNKTTKSVQKAEELVQNAKSIHQKLKTPESENLLIETQEHLQELNPTKFKKIKRIHPDIIPCIKTFYFKKDSKWKDYFPPKTIGFRIMKGDTYNTSIVDVKCNFIMALQILKDYDEKYSTLTIRDLKEMLIQAYTHLSESVDSLEKKFKKEKKRFKKWSDILMESYPFTQLDLLVLMHEYKLPVVLFLQTKNNIHLITYHTNDTFKYYIKMKKKDVFMFFIYQHQFKIERKDMNALYEAERDIVYLSQPEQRNAFFDSY